MSEAPPDNTSARPLRVGFDVGGVISKQPDIFRAYIAALVAGGVEVYVITDMPDHAEVMRMLGDNGFGMIEPGRVRLADYATYGELCKGVLLRELQLDVYHDDFLPYLAEPHCPVRLLMMPDPRRPYYAPAWRSDAAGGDFCRRVPPPGTLSGSC